MASREGVLIAVYLLGDIATFVYLIFSDAADFNAWNWLIIVPVDLFLASIWPVYWAILVPIFGMPGA